MKRRWVPIPVDDPEVTHLRVHPFRGLAKYPGSGEFIGRHWVPVPSDDQLAKAIDRLTTYAKMAAADSLWELKHIPGEPDEAEGELRAVLEASDAVRAAFQLGEEE